MKTYRNAHPAPYGLYVSTHPLDMTFVSAEGEPIDGKAGGTYWRIPTLLALLFSPVIGGVFVLAFPLVMLAAIVHAMARLAAGAARRMAERHAQLARVRWEPATAYLRGSKGEEGEGGEGEEKESEELSDLAEEVRARRAEEEGEGEGEEAPEGHEEPKA